MDLSNAGEVRRGELRLESRAQRRENAKLSLGQSLSESKRLGWSEALSREQYHASGHQ
jgi:hypothetical protein